MEWVLIGIYLISAVLNGIKMYEYHTNYGINHSAEYTFFAVAMLCPIVNTILAAVYINDKIKGFD